MSLTDYTPPVSQLLSLGDVRGKGKIDYLALGLGPDHVPELGRMALDKDLWWADSESVEVWSAIHAWRALAQIGSAEAIPTLVTLLGRVDDYDDDWTMEEMPDVFAAIGPAALPALTLFLADDDRGMWARITCTACLEAIVKAHPETGAECIGILMRQLGEYASQPTTLNAFLISSLIDWKAVEAAPLIEEAFRANQVDPSVCGDWEDVQIDLGLLDERMTPRPNYILESIRSPARDGGVAFNPRRDATPAAPTPRQAERRQKVRAKQKRKQEKQSRRKQRK